VEQEKEKQVVDDFDAIVSVASPMTDYFKSISNGQGIDKFHTILNGYDPEDYKSLPLSPKKSTSILKIAFVGTLYNKTKQGLKALCAALIETDLAVEITFCGDMTDEALELLSQLNQVKLLGKVSGTEARSIINESDVAMLLLTDDLTYSFSTKFCEYISMKKPIWIISKEGETPAFIVDREIGVHSDPNKKDVLDGLQTLVQSISKLNYESFDARPFQIQKLSDDYVRIIRNLESKGE
jgi:glycosyltransferase involved in cell wall biosynthesis